MKREIYLSAFLLALILIICSCGGQSTANNASNVTASNGNANVPAHGTTVNRNNEPTTNNAPTLAPVVQQYYDALKNKDDEKLKETLTTAFLKNIEDDMKAENKKGLAAFVAETDYREGQTIEVRNEKIEGDKAVAELRGGVYKNWTPFEFAKENGKWKFTGGSPETSNMPKSSTNTVSPH
jgi:hypothetical protein